MSAGDILLTIVIWLYKSAVSLLPTDMVFLSYSTFTGYLDSLKDNLLYALSGYANLFPLDWLLIMVSVVIAGELILFGVKSGIFLVNLIRGSGA